MIKIKDSLSLKNIHQKVSQEAIWAYITGKDISNSFKLRREGIASCTITVGKSGDLLMRDWGDPNFTSSETWWRYLQRTKYGNSTEGFLNSLEEIRRAFGLHTIQSYSKFKYTVTEAKIPSTVKLITREPFVEISIKYIRKGGRLHYSIDHLNYWLQYGISKKKLKEKLVVPIEKFWINNTCIDVKNITFAYLHGEYDGVERYTIYSPLSLEYKWIKNTNENIVQNINSISDKGARLIIQTSYKDIMCMEELGYKDIVAPHAEGVLIPSYFIENFKERFNEIIYFANNDWHKSNNPGIGYAKVWNKAYNIPYIHTPDNTTSDVSDYYKKYGKGETIKLLNSIL